MVLQALDGSFGLGALNCFQVIIHGVVLTFATQQLYHAGLVSNIPIPYNDAVQSNKKNQNIRLLSTDLDGTLLNRMSEVSKRNQDALRALHDQGVIIVINSGRSFESICGRIPDDLYDYASCMNGQDVYSVKLKQHFLMPELDRKDITDLFEIVSHHMSVMEIYAAEDHYSACSPAYAFLGNLYAKLSWLRWRICGYHPNPIRLITNAEDIPCSHVPKVCFTGRARQLEEIRDELPKGLDSTLVNLNWMEVQKAGISKGAALKKILEAEHLDGSMAVGFGDGENDIPMLKECGTRIVMSNAMPNTKKQATELTCSNNEDGVAVWIEANLLD